MELKRDEIIKALEHCINDNTCEQCNYSPSTCFIQENALSLIKELTEENERLEAYINRCKSGEEYWVKCLIDRADETKADTLNEFKNRLAQAIGTYTNESYVYVYAWFKLIDQITKEMIENG